MNGRVPTTVVVVTAVVVVGVVRCHRAEPTVYRTAALARLIPLESTVRAVTVMTWFRRNALNVHDFLGCVAVQVLVPAVAVVKRVLEPLLDAGVKSTRTFSNEVVVVTELIASITGTVVVAVFAAEAAPGATNRPTNPTDNTI